MRLAALLAAATRPPQPLLTAVGAGAWLVLVAAPQTLVAPEIMCGTGVPGKVSLALAAALLLARPPVGAWFLMLLAMMLPLLARPLSHLWVRSLTRRRWRSIALFLLGYAATWAAAAIVLVPLAVLLRASVGTLSAIALALLAGLAWRTTPAWQFCQNRCHRVPRLDAFGLAADRDCLVYGASAASWCIGTCWALMLLPLVAGRAHLVVMPVVTLVAFVERQAPPRPMRRSKAPPDKAPRQVFLTALDPLGSIRRVARPRSSP